MSDIKMAELFKLPISPIKGLGQTFIDRGLMLCDAEADAACVAVNSHDKLTSQVAELMAALKKVAKATEGSAPGIYKLGAIHDIANRALKESEL